MPNDDIISDDDATEVIQSSHEIPIQHPHNISGPTAPIPVYRDEFFDNKHETIGRLILTCRDVIRRSRHFGEYHKLKDELRAARNQLHPICKLMANKSETMDVSELQQWHLYHGLYKDVAWCLQRMTGEYSEAIDAPPIF